jgi:GNAT superfamily N-acetyltransferase
MRARKAIESDAPLLGELNHQLIRDEGHRNPMTVPELEERMRGWLAKDYTAVLFENETGVAAYALYREEPEFIYLRQLFVRHPFRRQGSGREAFQLLRNQFWPAQKRLCVEVLTANKDAILFWKAIGFQEYSLALEILPPAK